MRKDRDRRADILFIRQRMNELAAMAWKGYEEHGRGYICVCSPDQNSFPNTKDILPQTHTPVDIYYCTADHCHDIELLRDDYPTDNTEDMVNRYDADWEIVVLVQREDGEGWSGYRMISPVKPSDAYHRLAEKLKNLRQRALHWQLPSLSTRQNARNAH